ncbi:pilus assembly protein TadG-related protein [Nocardioides sp. CPCC 205120]|uniref:pilus assembly protein TadG-related protein n=1 Tax=Nocardioides sp. CPCC 205120 TaxID=3406462 RepID=UPI003B508182
MARGGQHDQRGAVAVVVAGMMVLFLLLGAMAVDLGMQRVARRDAQAVADLVSLDMARQLDGQVKGAYAVAALDRAFAESLRRNADGLGARPEDFSYELGRVGPGGAFESIAADVAPDAVAVTTTGSVDRLFAVGTGEVSRRAVATADQSACFRVGSYLASLDTADSALLNPILSALLGSTVSLDAVSYRGLAGASVSLLELVDVGGLRVGSVSELLALPALSVADLFVASANVLDAQGNAAQADVLRMLALGVGTPTIAVADLVNAAPGNQAALTAGLNVLELVSGTAYLVNAGNTVAVEGLSIGLPSVATTSTTLTVVEPPQPACARVGESVEASTAQVRLDLSARVEGRSLAVPLVGTVALAPTEVRLALDLGKAVAQLRGVRCGPSGPEALTVALRSAVIGDVEVAASTRVTARIDPVGGLLTGVGGLLRSLLGIDLLGGSRAPYLTLDAGLAIGAGANATGFDRSVTLPLPGSYDVPVGSGSGRLLTVPTARTTGSVGLVLNYYDPGLLGIGGSWKKRDVLPTGATAALFADVLDPVLDLVLAQVAAPVVAALETAVAAPLSDLLGLELGGARVFALREPGCGTPRLQQ